MRAQAQAQAPGVGVGVGGVSGEAGNDDEEVGRRSVGRLRLDTSDSGTSLPLFPITRSASVSPQLAKTEKEY